MLPFTKEKLLIKGDSIFYYDRKSNNKFFINFSQAIHQDLKDYLGIQRELRLREVMSEAVTNEQKRFDTIKIHRIGMFYDNYVDQVLEMMQMLYYENFMHIKFGKDYKFYEVFKTMQQTGIQLEKCFNQSLELCEDLKQMIQKQIKKQYPLETFQDKLSKNKK